MRAAIRALPAKTRQCRHFSTARHERPFRMAVIGSGPAGFYTAYRIMGKIDGAKVDMYEALPVPYGLVRFGVAPDHPEVKNCREKFEQVASSPDFTFVGNVSVGRSSGRQDGVSVALASVLGHYDAVCFAYGAAEDKKLGVPGENLEGIYSARDFVGWYNGLPENVGLAPDLGGEHALIVGQGNVALDVARMLLTDIDSLRKTDMSEHALEVLSKSKITRVSVLGRRGPMQAAFTTKELRELMKLPNVVYNASSWHRSLIPQNLETLPRQTRRLMDVLLKGSITKESPGRKSWSLEFCMAPTEFLPNPSSPTRVGATQVVHNMLSSPFDPNAYAKETTSKARLPSSVVLRSIGYKAVALPEFADLGVPFDHNRGVIMNDGQGRVVHEARAPNKAMAFAPFPGLYCAGWVKTGPTGVIASTMEDAFVTAHAIAQDWASGGRFLTDEHARSAGWEGVRAENQSDKACVVTWDQWQKIDEAEKAKGHKKGKEREKFVRTVDMLQVLG